MNDNFSAPDRRTVRPPGRRPAVGNQLISIVIPTHNRLALVADAIETVRADRKYNWELVIFDNGSEEPLEAHVKALNDDRIRFFVQTFFCP